MFTLSIPVTERNLREIKSELSRTLPDVKSSHRCEAVARSLGYRTYAALLAAMRSAGEVVCVASGAKFSSYLLEHGFHASAPSLYLAVSKVAIRAAQEAEPRLTRHGIGIGRRERKPDRTWETPGEQFAKFADSRSSLLTDSSAEEFLRSLALLKRILPTATIRPGTGSYRLKHIAEKYPCTYPEGEELGPRYVANGSFIAAAIHAGFRYKRFIDDLGYDVPNVNFNMSKVIIDDLDCEMRPGGGYAEDRRFKETQRDLRKIYGRTLA